jgi:glycosyltransferase involved in cell wall biosynthesis
MTTSKISCLMPTRNRRRFVPQAVKYFLQQDYPEKELIVVDDGEDMIRDLLPEDSRIRYIALSSPLTIGMKRNIAAALATGDIFCHWDDDDYFGSQRLRQQAFPLLSGEADVSALRMSLLLTTQDGMLWECAEHVHRALFAHNVRSGTLLYRASYWHDGLYYENRQTGEDVELLHGLLARHATLARIVDPQSYICVRHGSNETVAPDGMHPPDWQPVPLAQFIPPDDLAFYAQLCTN